MDQRLVFIGDSITDAGRRYDAGDLTTLEAFATDGSTSTRRGTPASRAVIGASAHGVDGVGAR